MKEFLSVRFSPDQILLTGLKLPVKILSGISVTVIDLSVGVQGGLVSSKISGVGANFGLLVHVLPGLNKQRARKLSMLMS